MEGWDKVDGETEVRKNGIRWMERDGKKGKKSCM